MAKTLSTMMELGTKAPDFTLMDVVSGQSVSLQGGDTYPATVILFICNHCPFVKHIQTALVNLAKTYKAHAVRFIAINSNDVAHYPEDSPEKMRLLALQLHYPFPYLYDETQAVAHAYQAACTPDIFVFDAALCCVYRGQFDASSPGNGLPATGNRLSAALDCILAHKTVDIPQLPSIGCNIKWH